MESSILMICWLWSVEGFSSLPFHIISDLFVFTYCSRFENRHCPLNQRTTGGEGKNSARASCGQGKLCLLLWVFVKYSFLGLFYLGGNYFIPTEKHSQDWDYSFSSGWSPFYLLSFTMLLVQWWHRINSTPNFINQSSAVRILGNVVTSWRIFLIYQPQLW